MGNKIKIIPELKHFFQDIRRNCSLKVSTSECSKLTSSQGFILNYLMENKDKDVFQKDIERKFNIRRSTATETLKIMECNGLIKKETVETDARLKKIVLTDYAIQKNSAIEKELNDFEELITKNISNEELTQFLNTLEKIKKNMG